MPASTTAAGAGASGAADAVLAFGAGFRLDPRNARLRDGERELELPPKAFAVLCHLAARPGQLVTKDELLDAVWGHRFVSESVLKTAVSTIRAVLGDDTRAPRFVETVSRRGYRFVAALEDAVPAPAPATVPPTVESEPEADADVAPDAAGLIGRAQALAGLGERLDAALAGQRQMVLVAGEAGIGKTALLHRLAERAQARGAWVASGQCVEQVGGGEPYLPVLDALAELSRGPDGATWLAALRQVAPTWLAQLPWLVPAAEQAALQQALAGALQDRMLREFGTLLDAVTPSRPLVLLVEDLHWSDHATVNLLGYLARRRGPARLLLVASYRPIDAALGEHPMQALRQELRLHRLCTELLLEPFSELDIDHYLRARLGDSLPARHEAWARQLHAHTEGLPLFVAHLVDDLAGEGAFAPGVDAPHEAPAHDPGSDPAALLARLQVPDTLSGVVERQIARLPGELRALLEAAAVLGLEFAHPALAALLGWDDALLRTRCDGLVRRAEWLRSAGLAALPDRPGGAALAARYAFRHALHRRVFLQRLSPAQRLQLHLQAAQALQAVFGTQADRHAADIALHLESAVELAPEAGGVALPEVARDALAWRLRAAHAAAALHAPEDALAHLARARRSQPGPADRVRIGVERAALLQQLGRGGEALRDSGDALAEARTLGDPAGLHPALATRARVCQENDLPDEAIALVDELLAGAGAPQGAARGRALMVQAQALVGAGRLPEAAAVSRQALDAVPADEPAARADILAAQVLWHFHRATFAEGLAIAEQAMALYEQAGDARGAAYMAGRRGAFLLNLARADEAVAALRDARQRSIALHDVPGLRTAVLNLVKVLTDRGDAASAQALLDEGWQAAPDFESPVAECAFLHGFYYCHYLRGELGAALADAERVRASAEGLNSVYWRIGSAALVVGLHLHLGDLAAATALLDQALALAHAREVHHLWPRVMSHRAWLDLAAGDPARALARLDEVDASGDPVPDEDRAAMQRVRAEALLVLGRPAEALAVLDAFDTAPTQEVWAPLLALRLQARRLVHGAASTADLARAQADLADDRLPALERWRLRHALAEALRAAGQAADADAQAALADAEQARLAASLQAWPERQAAFLRAAAMA